MNNIMRVSHLACIVLVACSVQACAANADEQAAENNPVALRVRDALNKNPAVVSSDFGVTASGSEVRLTGVARNKFQMDQALETAKNVPGVTNVVDDIALDYSMQSFK